MAIVEFLGPINREPINVEISNLTQLKEIFQKDDELKEWLETCAVALNDTLVDNLDITINSQDKISLLPPVCGG